MEQHPQVIANGVQRASGEVTPFNAGDALAAVIDMYGLPIPRSHKSRIGKDAKELLEDGFAPNIVCAAMLTAVQMARPHLVQSFALELQNEAAGVAVDWHGYRQRLHEVRTANSPGLQRIYSALEEAFKK